MESRIRRGVSLPRSRDAGRAAWRVLLVAFLAERRRTLPRLGHVRRCWRCLNIPRLSLEDNPHPHPFSLQGEGHADAIYSCGQPRHRSFVTHLRECALGHLILPILRGLRYTSYMG